jgi:hypothetical protein
VGSRLKTPSESSSVSSTDPLRGSGAAPPSLLSVESRRLSRSQLHSLPRRYEVAFRRGQSKPDGTPGLQGARRRLVENFPDSSAESPRCSENGQWSCTGKRARGGGMARPPVPVFGASKPAVPKFGAASRRDEDDEVRRRQRLFLCCARFFPLLFCTRDYPLPLRPGPAAAPHRRTPCVISAHTRSRETRRVMGWKKMKLESRLLEKMPLFVCMWLTNICGQSLCSAMLQSYNL